MGSYLEWFRSCSRITVTAHPAIAVPAGFTDDGLPIGLQLVGRYRGEAALLRLAHAFTEATGLAARTPGALTCPGRRPPPTAAHRAAYADAEPRSFWLAGRRRAARRRCTGVIDADLCIVGGGFTGLWAALHAKADDPARDVVAARGRDRRLRRERAQRRLRASPRSRTGSRTGSRASPTRWTVLERLGLENFAGLRADLERHGIDCDFEPTGELLALTDAYQEPWLEEERRVAARASATRSTVLDGAAMRAEVASPTYVGGVWDHTGAAILDPGKLAAGPARRGDARRRARATSTPRCTTCATRARRRGR